MGNKRDYRERGRDFRGDRASFPEHDEPRYFQRPAPAASDAIAAEVLWFNPDKGFGFVKASDGSEAFLHIQALEAAGHSSVSQGAQLKILIKDAPRGKQVAQVLEVTGAVAPQAGTQPADRRVSQRSFQPNAPEQEREGTVKWYNADKGFGFISLGNGERDVFVHASALTRSGMSTLAEGQGVIISVAQGQKGPEARTVRPV